MKATARISTDQYEFIELHLEGEEEYIWDTYQSMKRLTMYKGEGLSQKDFNTFVDRYLLGVENNHVEDYEKMNQLQKFVVQEIKKSLARIKSRQRKQHES